MSKELTVREHLESLRDKAHETQRKNGHYHKMVKARESKKLKKK